MNAAVAPWQTLATSRDCEAVLIPHGTPIRIPAGTAVYVTQALGGSVTVEVGGNLARIAGRDLDALGFEPRQPAAPAVAAGAGVAEDIVWDQLRQCYDPEIPVNIVDLGLVYECRITPLPEGDGHRVDVRMTLTAPGCGMGEFLVQDVRARLEEIPGVTEVNVVLTFDPPWHQGMMSDAARLQTGMY
jgi:probable FeS assembly SUF system protein SufT